MKLLVKGQGSKKKSEISENLVAINIIANKNPESRVFFKESEIRGYFVMLVKSFRNYFNSVSIVASVLMLVCSSSTDVLRSRS